MKNLRVKANIEILKVQEYKKRNGDIGYKTVVNPPGGDASTVYLNERLELGEQEMTISIGVSKKTDKDGKVTPIDDLYITLYQNKSE